jgi:predicted TIM-barrel fold metal-dependent hydrolase
MRIVDAQVHIWSNGPPTVPAHRQVAVVSKDEVLREMEVAGVAAAVLHPPSWDPNGNTVAGEAAIEHPDTFGVLGHFPLDRPESRALVDHWKERPGMLGLRFAFLQPHQRKWWTDGTLDWLWPAVERAGLPVALLAPNFLPIVGQIAQRHPGLRLIVDHLGGAGGTGQSKDAAAFDHLPELVALARYSNVAVKATGAPGYSTAAYPYRNIHPYLHQIYDAFGPERMFWGTDITRMPCSWRQCVTMYTEELPWLTERDKTLIMGDAVCDWLGWHPATPAVGPST